MPERIQLRRTKGFRLPVGAISVARLSRWGNPWKVGDLVEIRIIGYQLGEGGGFYCPTDERAYDHAMECRLTAEQAVHLYRQDMLDTLAQYPDEHLDDLFARRDLEEALEALRGHDLACWCPPAQVCHADVLLDLANRAAP